MTDLSPEARALLDLARDADGPDPADRLRVKHALMASIATGAAAVATSKTAIAAQAASVGAGATTAVVAQAGGVSAVTWASIGALVGLATAGSFVVVTSPGRAPAAMTAAAPHRPASADDAPSRIASPPALVAAAAAAEEAPGAATEAAPLAPTDSLPPSAPANTARAVAARAPASSLPAETSLLEAARAALGRGDARSALDLLEEHEREFPAGTLVEERLASKVFALCGLGRRSEAAAAGALLLKRAPASPLRARVLDSCAYQP